MGTTRLLYWLIALLGPVILVYCGGVTESQGQVEHPHELSAMQEPRVGGFWHQVGDDENLRQIAQTYYGSSHHWRLIQLSNDVGMYPSAGERLWVPAGADAWFAEEDYAASLLSEVQHIEQNDVPSHSSRP